MSRFMRSMLMATGVCALVMCGFSAQAQQYGQYDSPQPDDQSQPADADQSPGRVARLAYLSGQVQFAPAGEDNWGTVDVNRPMVIGDRLLTGDDGLAVLELGDASVRIDHDTAFDFLNLDENNVQVELSQGTLNLAVRQLGQGENFEVDTPTVAFVASAPGSYRIDDDPSGTGSMVTVFQGSGTVYGENGVSRDVVAGTSYRFNDSALTNVEENGLPPPDDFDRFCEARDANYARYAQQQQQYVPPDMIGADDLYQYGQWNNTPDYGNVWYPTSVPAGWAPYRYGHWAWIDPWGWTWVGDEPWGFAPFHYGRWAYISNRWGWIPGPVNVQPVYAPALVAFVGGAGFSLSIGIGGGGPVGWFPLGPRDVYVPWFHASQRYFTNVNVTNIRNVYVNRTVINNYYSDYRAGRAPSRGGQAYAYRSLPQAVTAVPRNVFTGARPVHAAALKLNRAQLARTEVAVRPAATPAPASLGVRRPTAHPAVLKGHQPFTRPVVARHAPPPRPVSFAAREKVIASQHGQPLTAAQVQQLRRSRPAPAKRTERVKLVPAVAHAAPATPSHRANPARSAQPPARRNGSAAEPFRNTVHPIPARKQPTRPAQHPGELPSARFAHPGQRPAGEPQRNAPNSGRLPAVKPVEPASRAAQQAAQRQRQAAAEQHLRTVQAPQHRATPEAQQQAASQERAREQQAQQQRRATTAAQQRQAEEQAQQRAREQQAQQRQAEVQAQQHAREQQVRQRQAQQRQAEVQAQQRAREQAMQQQRETQQRQLEQQRQMEQQRAAQAQAQQRAAEMQRQRQSRVPEQRGRPAPERRAPPPKKRPPPSSSGGFR